jgi:hypothetical protein
MLMPSETEMVVNARRAAAGDHAFLRVCRLFGERAVAGRRIAGGGDDADEGPRDGCIVEAHAAHEGPMRCAVDAVSGDARTERKGRQAWPHECRREGMQLPALLRAFCGWSTFMPISPHERRRYTRQL